MSTGSLLFAGWSSGLLYSLFQWNKTAITVFMQMRHCLLQSASHKQMRKKTTINCGNINTWINNYSFYFNRNWSKLSSLFRHIKPPQQCLCHLCDLTWVLSCIYLSATNEVGAKPGTVEGYPSIRPYRKRQRQSFGWALCDCIWRKIGTLALISSHQPLYKYEERALWCG